MPEKKYYYDIGDRVYVNVNYVEKSGVIVDEDVVMGGIAYCVRFDGGREIYFRPVNLILLKCLFKEV